PPISPLFPYTTLFRSWATVNQITLRLPDDVALWVGDLAVLGLNAADYPVSNFTYDRSNRTATWTLAQRIQSDKLLLDLSPDMTRSEEHTSELQSRVDL